MVKREAQKTEEETKADLPLSPGEEKKASRAIKRKSRKKRTLSEGIFFLQAGLNNTLITLADKSGNVVASTSTGQIGFKGSRKATPFAASKVARSILEKAQNLGLTSAEIWIKGVGMGRESALRTLGSSEIHITTLKDLTPLPHNGPRPKRPRRV